MTPHPDDASEAQVAEAQVTEAQVTETHTAGPSGRERSRSEGLGGTIGLAMGAVAVVVALGFVIWNVFGPFEVGGRDPQTLEFVVPKGTKKRQKAGEKVVVMPSRLEFKVGDTLVIRNEDVVRHPVGPYMVRALNEITIVYGAPGVYEGYCPLSDGEQYKIVVTE